MRRPKLRKLRDKRYRMRFIYASFFKSLPVKRDVILFESFHGKEISDTPLAMARALLSKPEAAEYKLYFSTNNLEKARTVIAKLGLDIEPVHIHSDKYAELLASAGYLINNSSFPSYFTRREEQIYLQTWHGTPWKTLGKSMKGELSSMHNAQHNFLQASHLLFPNEFTRDAIMRDYILEDIYTGKVIVHGYPRNSVFCDRDKAEEIKRKCGDENLSTLVYMPTWRGQDNRNIQTDSFVEETKSMLGRIDEMLSDDQKMYVNLHPIVQSSVDLSGFSHIHTFPIDVEKYEFINSADALITDYSSIFFDYSITGKPIILFTYDYDNYVAERGMYFDISELPFLRADTEAELADLLKGRKYESLDYSKDESYRDKFIKYDDINAADTVMEYLLDEGADDGEKRYPEAAGRLMIDERPDKRDKEWKLLDCASVPTPFDLDSISDAADEDTVVVFHQAHFGPKTGERMLDLYDGKYPYVFTTESVPETYAESLGLAAKSRGEVRKRNVRRQVADLSLSKVQKHKLIRVEATSVKTSGSVVTINMKAPAEIGDIKRVVLTYRSDIEEISHELDTSTHVRGGDILIRSVLDTSVLRLGCIYWDISVEAGHGDKTRLYNIMLRFIMRTKLKTLYYQCEHGDYIAFPHIAQFRNLAFTLREKTPYDNRATRAREIAAYAAARLTRKRLAKRKIWLVFEKFCSAAQDNGYYFFKYCMENLPDDEKRNIYYVIDKNARDYENVKAYGRNVIQFMSFRHLVYCVAAGLYVGSDSRKHLYIWRAKPNLISGVMRNKPIHFLQHGVTALKRVEQLFGARGSSPMTSITTTSDYEQKIMEEYLGYPPSKAPVTGFTRWDVLEDKSSPEEKLILVMPTWRAWLEEKPEEEFLESDYFRNYMQLLQDESLLKSLEESGSRLVFFIHPKFKDYLSRFTAESDLIELVQFGTKPLNEIMMHCSMLVTDYSSVCWDVYYLGKPVLFYQFDYDMYMENHGSYMNMETELFGDRYTKLGDLVEGIRENIRNGFKENEKAVSERGRFFKYIDSDNSRRTYEYLKKSGY